MMQLKTAGLIVFVVLTGCAKEEIAPARFVMDQCRRLALVDSETGAPLRGAEDIVLDTAMNRIFIAAYDRRAVEKAARKKSMSLPQGGIYAVSLNEIFDTKAEVIDVTPLISSDEFAGGLRPHGLSFDKRNQEIVFINRSYQRINGKWRMSQLLRRVGVNGELFVGERENSLCAANDVLVTDQQVFTSFDHGSCGWRGGIEDVFNLKRSGLSSSHNGIVYKNAAFANGLVRTPMGDIILAATRENALLVMKELSEGVEQETRIKLPGGPDNLSISYDGGVVAATHPSLWRLALNRKIGIGKSPSRIVKADIPTGAVDILFDDPTGKLFSAATIGVETQAGLVAGSVTDEGLLVCSAVQ